MASDEPPEKDMKDFEFVQLCKFRVSEPGVTGSTARSQLLTCSSTYGLVIFATKSGFNVVKTSDLLAVDEATGPQRNKVTIKDIPLLSKVILPCPPSYLGVSGDGLFLLVVCSDGNQTTVVFYDVHGFADTATSPQPFAKLPLTLSPGVSIVDIAWNPAIFPLIAICQSDGAMVLAEISEKPRLVASLPSNVGCACASWSPKGKQLLVGKKDGSLSQYDHALTEKKKWSCPSIFGSGQTVVNTVWLSTYMFLAAYLPSNAQESDQPHVVMTVSNKENKTLYINFDDVCFSSGEERKPHYFFHNLQKWEVVLMASSRATEATLVGKDLDNKTSWEHWNMEDTSRAELPLTDDQCDSFPLGLAVDYSPQKAVVMNETKTFPACPVMYLLSTDGLLLAYHLHYSHREASQITTPSQPLNPAQAKKGVPGLFGKFEVPSATQPSVTGTPFSFNQTPSAAGSGVSLTEPAKTPFGAFNPTSAAKPVAPSFQFVKGPETATNASAASQKPSLLSAALTTSLAPGPAVSSSFGFAFGGTANKPGSSSAFASIPASGNSPAASNTASPGHGFGQASTVSMFGSTATSAKTTSPFLPPNTSAVRPTMPVAPASTQPAPTLSNMGGIPSSSPAPTGIFTLKKTQDKPAMDAKAQQPPAPAAAPAPSKPLQQPLTQQPASSMFGGAGPKPSSPFMASNPPSMGFGGQPPPATNNFAAAGAPKPGTPGTAANQSKSVPQDTVHSVVDSSPSIEAALDSAFSQNIAEEISHFEEEMKKLRHRSKREFRTVGTRTEMQTLRRDAEETVNFLSDIKDVVKDQLHEVQDQKSNCFNLFADMEKSKTQLQRNSDPHYHSLLQGRALDPTSAEQLKSIQQMSQLLEQTLSELNHTLDSQWNQHLALKTKQSRLSTPTGDTIYKAIKNNHQIISHQRRNLEKLEDKMSNLRLSSKDPKTDRLSVFSLIADETPSSASKQEFSPGPKKPLTLKAAVSQGMTPEKVSRVKDYLSQRRVSRVKSKTPANLSLSRIVSTTPRRPVASTPAPKAAGTAGSSKKQSGAQTPSQQSQSQQPVAHGRTASLQNTPTGIPTSELRLQKGLMSNPDVPKPATQEYRFSPQQPQMSLFGGSAAGGQQSGLNMQQQSPAPRHTSPTSFSGVAYFKQPQTGPSQVAAQAKATPPHLQQQVPADLQAATEVLQRHLRGDGLLNLPTITSTQGGPEGKLVGQFNQQNMYEDITPTETDETNEDDDDDYEEEDNGYEDEDEEEYEEQEHFAQGGAFNASTGGKSVSFFSPKTPTNSQGQTSSQPAFSGTAGQGQTQAPHTAFTSSTASKSLFGDQTSAKLTSVSVATTTTAPGFGLGSSSNLFGPKLTSAAPASGTPSGSGFGGSTLGRSVGFSDLVKGTSDSQGSGGSPAATGSMFGLNPAASTTGTAKPAAPSLAGFNFMAPASSTSSSTPSGTSSTLFGGVKTSLTPANPNSAAGEQVSPMTSAVTPQLPSGASPASTSQAAPSIFGMPSSTGLGEAKLTTPKASPVLAAGAGGASGQNTASPSSTQTTPPPPPPSVGVVKQDSNLKSSPAPDAGVFAASANPNTLTASLDGKAATTSAPSLFGLATTTTTPSLFGLSSSSSSATTTASLFGSTTSTPVFGGGVAAPTSTTSSSTPAPIFGVNSSSTASVSNLFGSAAGAPSTTTLFGGNSTTPGLQSPAAATSTTAATPLFGGVPSTANTTPLSSSSSSFGDASKSTSLFGAAPTTPASSTSLFGSSSAATPALPSLFGKADNTASTAATSTPGFGAGAGTPSSAPLFGSTATTSAPLFGSTATTSAPQFGASPSVPFGSSVSTTSPFGSKPATTSPFFGGAPAATTSTPSVFGGSPNNSSGGGAGSSFSFSTQPSGSTFGSGFGSSQASTTSAPAFAFNQPPAVNSANAPAAASSGGGASSLFGGFGLGAKPSEEKANTNVFGSPQVFGGTPTTQSNLFGSTSSSPFGGGFGSGGAGTGSGFSSPSVGANSAGIFSSTGAGGVASTGFGVATNSTASSTGFGSSPAFGSAPSFGGGSTSAFGAGAKPQAGFGAPSVFGGGASFGSNSSTFGNSTSTGGVFGSAAGNVSSAGFNNFATSSAPTFGQLAQGSPSFGGAGNSMAGGFGNAGQTSSPFGGAGGGNAFGGASVFGQAQAPSGGGSGFGSPQPGFGNQSNFGSSPAFSSYRG